MTKLFLHYNCKSPPFSLSLFPLPTIATNPPPSETRNQPTADSLFPSSLFHLPTVVFQANSPLSPKSDLQRSPHNFTRGFLVDVAIAGILHVIALKIFDKSARCSQGKFHKNYRG
ncbi:hypothetical protein V6Z11_A10G130800 [Gossypium hirsutum]